LNYKDKRADDEPTVKPMTTYIEKKIGNTLYRVTSIYKGEIDFKKAIEDLTIRKILRDENVFTICTEGT
jgi:hypothetical protein